jgi:hypothetical protein
MFKSKNLSSFWYGNHIPTYTLHFHFFLFEHIFPFLFIIFLQHLHFLLFYFHAFLLFSLCILSPKIQRYLTTTPERIVQYSPVSAPLESTVLRFSDLNDGIFRQLLQETQSERAELMGYSGDTSPYDSPRSLYPGDFTSPYVSSCSVETISDLG